MVKLLSRNELTECVKGGELFFKEGGLPGEFKPDVFVQKIGDLIDANVAMVIGCFNHTGAIQGAIAFSVYEDIYTGDRTATEMWWFVLPEHRGGSVAMRLIRAFEKSAQRLCCKRVCMVHLAALQEDRLSLLYQTLGYKLIECCYAKTISG